MRHIFASINSFQLWALPITALCLALVSGLFEYHILKELTDAPVLAAFIVSALEILKVCSILYSSVLSHHMKGGLKAVFRTLQCTLLFVSLAASTFFISSALDRPNRFALMQQDQQLIENRYAEVIERKRHAYENRRRHLEQKSRDEERRKFKNGGFRGRDYEDYRLALATLDDKWQADFFSLQVQRDSARHAAMNQDYRHHNQAANQQVASMIFVLQDTLGWKLRHSQVALGIALLLSFTLELAIFFSLFLFGVIHGRVLNLLHAQSSIQGSLTVSKQTQKKRHRRHKASFEANRPPRTGKAGKGYTHHRIVP